MSRAFYFIFVGLIAFFINLALVEIEEDFPPLCVYGFNVNSRSVLIFVRDGLLSKSVGEIRTPFGDIEFFSERSFLGEGLES